MRKLQLYSLISILTFLFVSCSSKQDNYVSLFKVVPTDFEDLLTVDGFVEPVSSLNVSCPPGVDGKIVYIIEDGSIVNEGDVICVIEDANIATRLDETKISLANAEANLNKTKAEHLMQYALLEAQVKTNEAQTSIENLDSLQLKYSSENLRKIKELELQKTAIEKQRFKKKLKSLEIIQRSEIRRIEMEIQRNSMGVAMAEQGIESLTIKAAQSGLVIRGISFLSGRKLAVGDNVWEGMPLVTMPELNVMKVKISASEGNYKRIDINDLVEYSFDAMPENKASGKITKKAPVGQPVAQNSKVKVFEIEATVDSFIHIPGPGLSTDCHVILNRIHDTIVIPQVAIFEEDSIKVVYVKTKKGFERRQIETGISSPKEAIVAKGLKKNERIALAKPDAKLITSKTLLPDSTKKQPTKLKKTKQNNSLKNEKS